MNSNSIEIFCTHADLKIVEAMQKIDMNSRGILFIIDDEKRLIGCMTDGDIRRWLIKTGDLQARVSDAMYKDIKYIHIGEEDKASACMKANDIRAIPVLNEKQQLVHIIFDSDSMSKKRKTNTLSNVQVIIMAGGKGTRLYPYTKILPKPLIPIGDIPIVERIINRFYEYGVSRYYMTVNYKKGMIKSYFAELSTPYSIAYIEEERPLGTAGSLTLIEEKFDKPVFVTNCDILINADYADIYSYHQKSENAMTIVTSLKKIEVPYGVLHSKEHGIVTEMEEKPALSYFINTGMYVLNPEVIRSIPANQFYHMTDLADALLKQGAKVGMYPVSDESFLDMGEMEEMKKMEAKLNIQQGENL